MDHVDTHYCFFLDLLEDDVAGCEVEDEARLSVVIVERVVQRHAQDEAHVPLMLYGLRRLPPLEP